MLNPQAFLTGSRKNKAFYCELVFKVPNKIPKIRPSKRKRTIFEYFYLDKNSFFFNFDSYNIRSCIKVVDKCKKIILKIFLVEPIQY